MSVGTASGIGAAAVRRAGGILDLPASGVPDRGPGPDIQRIVIHEVPAILGYERFLEHQERSTFGIVQEIVRAVLASSIHELDDDLVETFNRVLFGAM